MATNKKVQVQYHQINGDDNTDIYFKTRDKDVMLNDDGTEKLSDYTDYIKKLRGGIVNVKPSSTNGHIRVNDQEVTVYTHPEMSSITPGKYSSVNVNSEGHVTGGTMGDGTVTVQDLSYTLPTQLPTLDSVKDGHEHTVDTYINSLINKASELGTIANLNEIDNNNLSATLQSTISDKLNRSEMKIVNTREVTEPGLIPDARLVAELFKTIGSGNNSVVKVYDMESTTLNEFWGSNMPEGVFMTVGFFTNKSGEFKANNSSLELLGVADDMWMFINMRFDNNSPGKLKQYVTGCYTHHTLGRIIDPVARNMNTNTVLHIYNQYIPHNWSIESMPVVNNELNSSLWDGWGSKLILVRVIYNGNKYLGTLSYINTLVTSFVDNEVLNGCIPLSGNIFLNFTAKKSANRAWFSFSKKVIDNGVERDATSVVAYLYRS